MFELFSATNDIHSVNSLIPKLFDSMRQLEVAIGESKIVGVSSEKNCYLKLIKSINYKGVNIETWLNSIEKEIRVSVDDRVNQLIEASAEGFEWLKICENPETLPQIAYLAY